MRNTLRNILTIAIVGICGLFGWWVTRDLALPSTKQKRAVEATISRDVQPVPLIRRGVREDEFKDGVTVEMFASRNANEVILRFPSDDSYGVFLFALQGSKVKRVDQLDRLRAIRVGYEDWADLSELLLGENIFAYDALPVMPAPSPSLENNQDGLVGFGDGVLQWLGIREDNSAWGRGVKIAVLDSGVVPHRSLPGLSTSIEITPFPENLMNTHGHGTAVASLIAGNELGARGIAPAAEIISVRVSDEAGEADSFALAAGILAAIDSGAHIINISMGCTDDNPLIEDAVLYANERNVLIVAASGNSEQAEACYPAAYPSVVSVGAVDARGRHLDFSNYGAYLALTAPGYAVNAAWPGNRYASISGTSASAPIVTGAIAATMSNSGRPTLNASEAAEILMKYSDDAGIPGPDSEYGFGILNMARVMNRGIPGVVDGAIASQRIQKTGRNEYSAEIQVTIQNRGTAVLFNALLEIYTPFGSRSFNASSLAPGAIKTFSMPVDLRSFRGERSMEIESILHIENPGNDVVPENNRRKETLGWK